MNSFVVQNSNGVVEEDGYDMKVVVEAEDVVGDWWEGDGNENDEGVGMNDMMPIVGGND